jgi:uncharacterized protein (DUF433 family)
MVQATEYLYVVRDDEILHGEPIVRGTRTPVRAIVYRVTLIRGKYTMG